VLAGAGKAMQDTFGSACHGAGRAMSRQKAKGMARGRNIARELEDKGILIRAHSRETLVEEMSDAYKDVSDVVEACVRAGLAVKVAQIRPLVCIKG
jgi:tRNA-splicing ligase RtcB